MIDFLELPQSKFASISLFALAIFFVFAGLNHFLNTKFYLAMMPPYIPAHYELVILTGILEILGGIGLIFPFTRSWAGYGLILLMVAVFPANIYMAMNPEKFSVSRWALYLRLPLQFLLIWWIYWVIRQTS